MLIYSLVENDKLTGYCKENRSHSRLLHFVIVSWAHAFSHFFSFHFLCFIFLLKFTTNLATFFSIFFDVISLWSFYVCDLYSFVLFFFFWYLWQWQLSRSPEFHLFIKPFSSIVGGLVAHIVALYAHNQFISHCWNLTFLPINRSQLKNLKGHR